MKLNLDRMIIFWGALDLAHVLWTVGIAIYHDSIPYYTKLIADLDSGMSFGAVYPSALTIVG